MQPGPQFWLNRRDVGSLTLAIECDGGAFGVAQVPWAVPEEFQGKAQTFELAADVRYPEGRGRLLRYRDGVHVGAAKLEAWKVIGSVAAAFGGRIILWKPARWQLRLPTGVAQDVPGDAPISVETLWRPGDPDEPSPRDPGDPSREKPRPHRLRPAGPS